MQTETPAESVPEAELSEESSDTLTAGDILRQERERLGLNEKEVADQLHITMHYVKALESSSFEKLPGAVFAKGYMKSYGLLLGLDVQDLLSRYDEFANRQKADSEAESRLLQARKKKDRNKPLVIISLLIFVVGFLGLWLANSIFSEDPLNAVPSTVEAVDGDENARPASSQGIEPAPIAQPQLSVEVDPDEVVDAPSGPAVASAEVLDNSATPEQSVDPVSTPMPASDEVVADASPTLEDLAAALQALRAEQQASAAEPALESEETRVITVDAIGSDVLRISFVGESWVEVNDSESEQIYRDIRAAGDVLEITGSAPFNILLGDAPLARMSLNGNEIDLSADIRIDNSARLTVGL